MLDSRQIEATDMETILIGGTTLDYWILHSPRNFNDKHDVLKTSIYVGYLSDRTLDCKLRNTSSSIKEQFELGFCDTR